jgi:hypothetical protein
MAKNKLLEQKNPDRPVAKDRSNVDLPRLSDDPWIRPEDETAWTDWYRGNSVHEMRARVVDPLIREHMHYLPHFIDPETIRLDSKYDPMHRRHEIYLTCRFGELKYGQVMHVTREHMYYDDTAIDRAIEQLFYSVGRNIREDYNNGI